MKKKFETQEPDRKKTEGKASFCLIFALCWPLVYHTTACYVTFRMATCKNVFLFWFAVYPLVNTRARVRKP